MCSGTNFGTCSSTIPCSAAPNSWVTIGGQNCTNLTLFSDNRMRCVAPRGTGTNRTIRLSINGQESNEVLYSYERPSISVLVPRTSVQPDPTIYIEGFNFGFETSNIFVTFADTNTSMEYNCTSFVLSSDSSIRCYFANNTLPLFATFDVTIIVSGQKSLSSSSNKFYSGIPNNPPIAYPFNTSVNEDQSIVVQLEGSDPDAADAVKIYAVSTPQYGNLYYYLATSVDPKGPLIDTTLWPVELPLGRAIYFPPADYNGEDSFNFVVRDTYNEESTIAFANISVLPVSDPPVPIPFSANITEDTDLLLNFTHSDPDSPGTSISIIVVTLPSAGRIFEVDNNYAPITEITIVPFQLSNFTKTVMYKPPLNAAGTVNGLSFKARDETANSLNAAQVSILITPINDAPIAFNKTYSIAEDSATTISFDCQDVDMQDSLVVTVLSVPPPEAGILLNPGLKYRAPVYANDPVPASLTLELAKNYYGQFSIGYMCSDSSLSSEIAYIDVEVTNVNDAPMASSGIVLTDEDTDVLCQLNVSDVETPDQISITILDLPRQGMLLAQINDTDPLNDTWSVLTSDLIPWTIPFYRKNLTFRPTADTHGDPYATFTFRADDDVDKSNFATINVIVNSVNDPPTINLTSLDISAYEDQEVVITLDIKDVDMNDRLVVKITDIFVNGTLFHFDRRTNSRTQLTIGEGSEISGPPYVIVFRPSQNFYSETVESLQKFNVTFTDATGAGSSHLVNFSVLPVNDVPIINCASDSIDLPFNFVNGSDEKFNFTIGVTDVDDANVTLMLVNAPRLGYLSADGKTLKGGSQFTTTQLFFYANNSGGGYPYSNFSVYAVDAAGAVSSTCTFQFTFTCPPRLYNNIFSGGKGPICTDCPVGSFCR
ncbi:hypothetical protein BKA69DRAFT_166782 [Paraphysoderma sedebokerense]|nr:hypothetical protein BKA69DRAFT_166782 [Paraphysoderma sedebokerense]